jgi:hypothetical protein
LAIADIDAAVVAPTELLPNKGRAWTDGDATKSASALTPTNSVARRARCPFKAFCALNILCGTIAEPITVKGKQRARGCGPIAVTIPEGQTTMKYYEGLTTILDARTASILIASERP